MQRSRIPWVARWATAGLLLAGFATAPGEAAGQSPCADEDAATPPPGTAWEPPRAWAPPLDRRVSVRADGDRLGSVLERLSAGGNVRISYSGDVVPLDLPVCAVISNASLGDALRRVLAGVAVDPVAVDSTHVVLSPAAALPAPHLALPLGPFQLDSVVVIGRPVGPARTEVPHAVSVLSAQDLQRFGPMGLEQVLSALVPGFWSWGLPSGGALAGFTGLRGASSFGPATPKVYLDGIEIAHPALLSHLAPDAIERVEVIRGPQGAALYGADAGDGVIHIVSRRGSGEGRGGHAEVRSSATVGRSGSTSQSLLAHRHALTLRGGTGTSHGSASVVAGRDEAALPQEGSGFLSAMGAGTLERGETTLTGTSRLHIAGGVATPRSGVLGFARPSSSRSAVPEPESWVGDMSMAQYTVGTTLDHAAGERWTHQVVAGVDGYRSDAAPPGTAVGGTPIEGLGSTTRIGADRVTLRVRSEAELPRSDAVALTVTLTGEQLLMRDLGGTWIGSEGAAFAVASDPAESGHWRRRGGVAGHANVSLRESLFLTGGIRLEESGASDGFTALPQVGISGITRGDGWTLKTRGAFGRAMRSPADPGRFGQADGYPTGLNLEPELQSGIEAGFTVLFGRHLSLDLTRFDQTASNLVQRIGFGIDPWAASIDAESGLAPSGSPPIFGEISNRGWEAQGRLTTGELALVASAAVVDSRATQLPSGYSGDLRAGDRILGVPARSLALTGSWQPSPWSLSLTLRRAWNWIDYDRERLAAAAGGDANSAPGLTGADLRDYWLRRDSGLGADARIGAQATERLGVWLTGSNLLDTPLGGPVHGGLHHGRTLGLELRVRF